MLKKKNAPAPKSAKKNVKKEIRRIVSAKSVIAKILNSATKMRCPREIKYLK
jgi:hypothetical protein